MILLSAPSVQMLPLLMLLFWGNLRPVQSQRLRLHNFYPGSNDTYVESFGSDNSNWGDTSSLQEWALDGADGERQLQLDTGTLSDINATSDTCRAVGASIECNIVTQVTANDGTFSDLDILVICPLNSQIAFDFRRAQGCSCGTAVSTSDGETKSCACQVCPFGFGESPIAIDCETDANNDPFVISNCVFLDCTFACNGTCSFSCEDSGPECSFCANNPNAPTGAPLGDGAAPPTLVGVSNNGGGGGGGGDDGGPNILDLILGIIFAILFCCVLGFMIFYFMIKE